MSLTIHRNKQVTGAKLASARVPFLLNGDHLTVPEFERRYTAAPEDKRAELIEGIVIMSPPVSYFHAESDHIIAEHLIRYARSTPGTGTAGNASVRLDGKNEYQPDAILMIRRSSLAHCKVASDGLLEGAPELVVEIAVSSVGYDLHEKKTVYQRSLVPEYLVWQVMDSKIHWFTLENGEYVELKAERDGVTRSKVFPGLWLDLRALLAGENEKVSRTLEKGLKSAEHTAFVKRLAASK